MLVKRYSTVYTAGNLLLLFLIRQMPTDAEYYGASPASAFIVRKVKAQKVPIEIPTVT